MCGIAEIEDLVGDAVRAYVETSPGAETFREELRHIKFRHIGGCLDLRENDGAASLRSIHLFNLDDHGIALKPDDFHVRFFKANSWNKAVDYLILTSHRSRCYAIFIDLKSSINDKPDVSDQLLIVDSREDKKKEQQFCGAEALFDYLKMLLETKYGVTGMEQYQIRKWILYESVKTRSGVQSPVLLTAHKRKKSNDVRTMQVTDGAMLDVTKLL